MDIANLRAIISVETSRFRAGMAGVEGQLRGTEAQMRAVDAQSRVTGAAMATTGRQSALMATGAKLAKVGLAGVAFAAYEGFKRMKDQERVSAMTANTLKNTANAAGLTQGKVEALAGSLALMTGVSKSTVQGAENILLGFKNVTRDSGTFRQVLQASMDRSAKSGRDLIGVTRAIGMAFNDPIGGMGRLARAGIFLDSTTKEHIKEMTKAGKIDQARALILDKVSGSAKGAAAALGQTTTGQLNRMKEALGQMSEEVAQSLLPAILTIGPPLISLVRSLAPAFKMLAQGVAAIAQPFANVLSAITSSRAGTIALTTALGALIALGVGAKIAAWGKGIGQFVGSLTSGVSKIAGFGTAAAAAEAETTAVGGAMGAAGAEAGAMGEVMGGPVVWGILAATAATVAVGAVIGGDLVRSFMGAGSAADQYAEAMRRTKQATSDLHTTTASLPGALDNLAGAHRRVAAARRAADAAPGDLGKQAALKQSIVDEARARDASVAALRRSATANRNAATASEAEVNAAVRAKGIYPGMIGSLVVSEAAHRKYEAAVKRSAQTVGNTTAWKQAQADYASMAAKLQPLGGKYAVVAKEASKLSNMKPGPEATALAATIGKQLDAIAAKANGAKPKVKVDANTDAAKTKVGDLQTQVNTLTSKSWTVQVQVQQSGSLPSSMGGGGGKGMGGQHSKEREQQTASPYALESYRNLTSPQNQSSIVGSAPMNSGILDLIAQVNKAHIAFAGLGISEDQATQRAINLRTAIQQNANWHALSSNITKAHTASVRAKTDAEKESAKKALASAKAHLINGLIQDGVSPKVAKHASMTMLLGMAHDRARGKAHNLASALGLATDAQAILANALEATNASADTATPALDSVSTSLDSVTSSSDAAAANMTKAQSIVQRVIDKVRSALTPTEALIKSLQDAGQTQDLSNNVSDAQDALARAQEFGDSTQIRDAQRALTSASRAQQIAQLQPQADAERQSVNDYLDSLDPGAVAQSLIDSGGNVSNITFTLVDNTLTGLTRDQTDNLARQLGPALARQVGVTI